jgi:hypothetical protein
MNAIAYTNVTLDDWVMAEPDEPVLCFVHGNAAYFTTRDLSQQWGDDWDDAPYEHNAGRPYTPHAHDLDTWTITEVHWDGPFVLPDEGYMNSPFSVRDINKCVVPWLDEPKWQRHGIRIYAGTPVSDFIRLMKSVGGRIWTEDKT